MSVPVFVPPVMTYPILILIIVALAVLFTIFYRTVNKGLSSSSKHQQLTRVSLASVIAMLPWLVAGRIPSGVPVIVSGVVCVLWSITYPLLYCITNRRRSTEYDNQMDIVFGLYSFGFISALQLGLDGFPIIAGLTSGVVEAVMMALILSQWVYYLLYKECIDFKGMTIVQSTNVNEVIEFARSFSFPGMIGVLVLLVLVTVAPAVLNLFGGYYCRLLPLWVIITEGVLAVGLAVFIFIGKRSPLRRCGLFALYNTIQEYRQQNARYEEKSRERYASLDVLPKVKDGDAPRTIIMVIGESANRDYMSAFRKLDRETTPWLSALKNENNTILFPNAYSCAMVTVNSLERALTERNQYNDKPFFDSVSIIDIAHKLGYKVHWYSNQGHLGAFDTPVTLVANSSDVAKWTDQQLNKVPYDETLLKFLDEVDPSVNNFVVVHLKGSHFNFANRYPAEKKQWDIRKGEDANVINYLNSIHYTDEVLRRIYEYGRERLHLEAMVYFSDHATYPDRTRTPGFIGFGMTRIPLFVWLSNGYRKAHPMRDKALHDNARKYFTNDLVYELMCGIFDVESDHFDEENSLASERYKFTRDMLLTYDGKVRIADDTTDDDK